jgi:hypothetical protein
MPELDMDFELELATLLSSLQADREAVASEIEGEWHNTANTYSISRVYR